MTTPVPPIRLFISYARYDDAEFHMVDPFKSKLSALVRAKSGRKLDIFVDRDNIGWGENWRERLDESIQAATVFIPLLSATYLERPACREEFLAYNSKSFALGVSELLLPTLLFESPLFGPDSGDEVVSIAEALQWKVLESGILAGYDSPAWMQVMADLADSLLFVVNKAEARLEDAAAESQAVELTTKGDGEPPGGAASPNGQSSEEVPDDGDEDAPGLLESMSEILDGIEDMTNSAQRLGPDIEALGAAAQAVPAPTSGASPREILTWTIVVSNGFRAPATALEKDGSALLDASLRVDRNLSRLRSLASSMPGAPLAEQIAVGIDSIKNGVEGLEGVQAQMESLLESMKPAEYMSASLRKSLRPARRGLTAVKDSLNVISSW